MTGPEDQRSTIEDRQMVAGTPDLRVQILTLAEGEEVPWHCHTNVTDAFACLEGPMVVWTKTGGGANTAAATIIPPLRRRRRPAAGRCGT